MFNACDELARFAGVARLFPLPNLVLFPNVDQCLHIFEHRYRQMTADALDDDGFIALVLLTADWEEDYDGCPAIEQVACLGKIVEHELLADGRYNMRLRGVGRVRIEEELPDSEKLYRVARCAVVRDAPPDDLAEAVGARKALRDAVLARFDPSGSAHKQLAALFQSDSPLGHVCDVLGYSLPLPVEMKQQLLAEAEVTTRAAILTHALKPPAKRDRRFPPDFSAN